MAKKINDFIKLKSEKSKYCKGKTTQGAVKKAAAKYVKSTVAAGNKTKSEAEKTAKKVLASGCAVKAPAKKSASRGRVHVKEHDKAFPAKSRDTAGLHQLLKDKKLRLKHGYETTKIVRSIAGLKEELKKHGYVELVKVKHISKK